MPAEPALFRRRPHLRGTPFVSLGDFPTAVERVVGLLPDSVELWVKREDRAGAIYGGNKVRKLEFLFGEALARKQHRVITIGGWGSNHALATARYAAQLGLACSLRLFPQPDSERVRATLASDRAAGADVHAAGSFLSWVPGLLAERAASGYYIAGGGSSVTGTLGWVSAADELSEQIERGELPRPHAVYLALGSGGTTAGLLAGWRGSRNAPEEIVAVRVVERLVCGYGPTRELEERTMERLGSHTTSPLIPLRVVHDQIGRGYGYPTDAALAAVESGARFGLRLEPTYTGKAMAALIADAHAGLLDGKRVLFVATYSAV